MEELKFTANSLLELQTISGYTIIDKKVYLRSEHIKILKYELSNNRHRIYELVELGFDYQKAIKERNKLMITGLDNKRLIELKKTINYFEYGIVSH